VSVVTSTPAVPETSTSASAPPPIVNPAPASAPTPQAQSITPWDVRGSVSADGKELGIDYDKLIEQFGTRRIDPVLLERFEKVTGKKPHVFMRRGLFFSHR